MAHPVHVPFVTVEDSDDLVVSFGLGEHAQTSLTLLRTPKFESIVDEHERGVSVSTCDGESAERELLVSLKWSSDLVDIESTTRRYRLDVSAVETAEVKEAKSVLRKMNFDRRFKLENV